METWALFLYGFLYGGGVDGAHQMLNDPAHDGTCGALVAGVKHDDGWRIRVDGRDLGAVPRGGVYFHLVDNDRTRAADIVCHVDANGNAGCAPVAEEPGTS